MEQKSPPDISALLDLMATLRSPDGCPWDRAQTFASVAPYTIEEAYEVAGAIAEEDPAHMCEELGDLLFQVVFHARMAEERNLFAFADVVATIVAKMTARHPHVFGDGVKPDNAEAQTVAWDALKKRERSRKQQRILDDVPLVLPALIRAVKLQKRAATVGFDWDNPNSVLDKIVEESAEIVQAQSDGEPQERIEEEFGDLLFAMANLARHLQIDPEQALRKANDKFTRRFNYIEDSLNAKGVAPAAAGLEAMEALWQEAKTRE